MTSRKPLAFAPTYGTVEPERDAYLEPLQLRPLAKESGRYWSFHSVPTTVAMAGNRYAKSLKAFNAHNDERSFRDLLAEYADQGCPRPSGYADVFHERFKSPRVSWSVNSLLAPCLVGGWQSAQKIGAHTGQFYRYDMRSAYLWAATLGMPDTDTYTRSLSPVKNGGYDGVYRVRLIEPNPSAPFPFDRATEVLATTQEMETYNLRVSQIISGVTWKRTVDPKPMLDAIQSVSTWKLAGRSYWGRWAQLARVMCHDKSGKKWPLPSVTLNIPWAHMIVSRVKMRLWECASNAVHVYVDSVITTDQLRTGTSLGDWRLEKVYPQGVIIRGAGQYGDLSAQRLEKMTGARIDSPLRSNPALVA